MSKKDIAFAAGRVEGIRESGWTCDDCGNFYDAGSEHCPNVLLDRAVSYAAHEQDRHRSGKEEAKRAKRPSARTDRHYGQGTGISGGPFGGHEGAATPMGSSQPGGMRDGDGRGQGPDVHLAECACVDGPCCPWMGACDCQCLCDLIRLVEARVRAEYDPSESDADEGYRAGFAAGLSSISG